MQDQVEDSININDRLRSRQILKHEFPLSTGLVTIGLRRTVISPEGDLSLAQEKFQSLLSALKKIHEESPLKSGRQRFLVWVLDAGRGARPRPLNTEVLKLQSCLKSLEPKVADWLDERSVFMLAHARKAWIDEIAQEKSSLRKNAYGTSKCKRNAARFFREINRRGPPRYDDVYTVFLSPTDEDKRSYFGHRAPRDEDWEQGPMGERRDPSVIKDGVVSQIQNILRSRDEGEFEKRIFFKLFEEGFLALSLKEFCALKIY